MKKVLVAFDWLDVNGVTALRSAVPLEEFGKALGAFIDECPVRFWNLLRDGEIHIDYVQRVEDMVAISTDRNPDVDVNYVYPGSLEDSVEDLDKLLLEALNGIFNSEFVKELYEYAACDYETAED